MKARLLLFGLISIVAIGVLAWFFVAELAPTSVTAPTHTHTSSSTMPQIPGNNLTLGQDKNSAAGWYLIGYNGMALYIYDKDATGISRCVSACAVTWPPYIVTSDTNLVGEYPISGKIGTTTRADGSMQVTYNGVPLYFYSGDSLSGESKGVGVSPNWHVAKP